SAAGCTDGASVHVVVTPTPNVQANAVPNVVCKGEPVTITATGATTYTWSGGNGNAPSITVTPSITTSYTVNGSTSGCNGRATLTVVVQDCTGLSSQTAAKGEILVFPNPANQVVNIEVPSLPAQIEVADLTGRVLKQITADGPRVEIRLDIP